MCIMSNCKWVFAERKAIIFHGTVDRNASFENKFNNLQKIRLDKKDIRYSVD